jgi:hypothetical protein
MYSSSRYSSFALKKKKENIEGSNKGREVVILLSGRGNGDIFYMERWFSFSVLCILFFFQLESACAYRRRKKSECGQSSGNDQTNLGGIKCISFPLAYKNTNIFMKFACA